MKDQQVVIIINSALTVSFKSSNDMDEGFRGDWRLKPSPTKIDRLDLFLVFYLKNKDLAKSGSCRRVWKGAKPDLFSLNSALGVFIF